MNGLVSTCTPLADYLEDKLDENVYDDQVGAQVRTWLVNASTLADLGLGVDI